jgi:hypothetical protein
MAVFGGPNTGNDSKPISGHLLAFSFHGPPWLTGGPMAIHLLRVFVAQPRLELIPGGAVDLLNGSGDFHIISNRRLGSLGAV